MRNSIIIDPNPDLIFSADWHSRSTIPSCRIDNYLKAQERKYIFIAALSEKYSCPILIAGDVGNKPEWKNWLLSYWIIFTSLTNQKIYVVPGQHDLPDHELERWKHSGLGVLSSSDVLRVMIYKVEVIKKAERYISISPCPFGERIPRKGQIWDRNILVMHKMVIKDKPLWPEQVARTGKYFLKKYPMYDVILSGDNHNPFVTKYEGRILVNPGSLMRMTVDQKNHRPRVYLYYAKTNTVLPIFLPIQKNVVSKKHISKKKERQKRVKAYIRYLRKQYEIGLSFKKNILEYLEKNKIRKSIKKIILRNVKRKR